MLISTVSKSEDHFITHYETGFIAGHPEVIFFICDYDLCGYDDYLFICYQIPLPEHISKAATKRKAAYLAGRFATRLLLENENSCSYVGIHADKSPLWPDGIVGSISHTDFSAIAVISRNVQCHPGVDIEFLNPKNLRGAEFLITNSAERALLHGLNIKYELALLIVFSAKESLFKSLYPSVNKWFGFDEASITLIDITTQTFHIETSKELSSALNDITQFTGNYHMRESQIITLIL